MCWRYRSKQLDSPAFFESCYSVLHVEIAVAHASAEMIARQQRTPVKGIADDLGNISITEWFGSVGYVSLNLTKC
jgi:hypothetical protein